MPSSSEEEIFTQRRHRSTSKSKNLEDLFDEEVSYEEEDYSENEYAGELKGIFLEVFGDGTEYSYKENEVQDVVSESDENLEILNEDEQYEYINYERLIDDIENLTDFINKNILNRFTDNLSDILKEMLKGYSCDFLMMHFPSELDFMQIRDIKNEINKYIKFKKYKEKIKKWLENNCKNDSEKEFRLRVIQRIYRLDDMYDIYKYFMKTNNNLYAYNSEIADDSDQKIVNYPILPVDFLVENIFFSHKIYVPTNSMFPIDSDKFANFLAAHPIFKNRIKNIYISEGYYEKTNLSISQVKDYLESNLYSNKNVIKEYTGIINIDGVELNLKNDPKFRLPEDVIKNELLQYFTTENQELNTIREEIFIKAVNLIDISKIIGSELYEIYLKIVKRQLTLSVIDRIINGAIKSDEYIFIVTEDNKLRILIMNYLCESQEYISINKGDYETLNEITEKYNPSHIAITGNNMNMKYTLFKLRDNLRDDIQFIYVDDFNKLGKVGNVTKDSFKLINNEKIIEDQNSVFNFENTRDYLHSVGLRLIAPEIYFEKYLKSRIRGINILNSGDIYQSVEIGICVSLSIIGIDLYYMLNTDNNLHEILPGIKKVRNFKTQMKKREQITTLEELRNIFKNDIDYQNAVVYLRIFPLYPFYDQLRKYEILDSTSVHPQNYQIARIICAAAMDKEELDDLNPSLFVENVMENKMLLKEFSVPENNPNTNMYYMILNQLYFESRNYFEGVTDEYLFIIANFSLFFHIKNTYDSSQYSENERRTNKILLRKINDIVNTPVIFLNMENVLDTFNMILNNIILEAVVVKKINNCFLHLIDPINIFVRSEEELYPNETSHLILTECIFHSLTFSASLIKKKLGNFKFTKHPLFKPLSSTEAEDYLKFHDKLILLRLSSTKKYGIFTVKLDQSFAHIRVDEIYENNLKYKIFNKEYESIDKILQKFFYPYMKNIKNIMDSRLYKSEGKISVELSVKYPGYVEVKYKENVEYLKVMENGILFRNLVFKSIDDYVKYKLAKRF